MINKNKINIVYRIWIIFFSQIILCQEIPNEFFDFKVNSFLHDLNLSSWDSNTNFGPLRYNNIRRYNLDLYRTTKMDLSGDSINAVTNIGTNTNNRGSSIYSFGQFNYNKLYSYFYSRFINNPDSFKRYTGQPRDISRFGYTSGETDISGFGYQDNNFIFQLGRGRQSWGAGEEIQLAISETSPSYDYGLLSFIRGNWHLRYFHGFLEADSSLNRYINGRGLEWTNRNDLVISFSEIVIYSGENRPIDLAYLNPVSSHLEIELNNRQNKLGTDSGNAVWLASIDWRLDDKFRFSANYLIDEFVLDKSQKEAGKDNGIAWSSRISRTLLSGKNIFTIFGSMIYVGTHTFRHEDGSNNFVQRGKPLGWQYGSDARQYLIGLKYFNSHNLICRMDIGFRESGSNSIIDTPYEPYHDYNKISFPSGLVNEEIFINAEFQIWMKKYASFYSQLQYTNSNILNNDYVFTIGFDIYYLKHFKL